MKLAVAVLVLLISFEIAFSDYRFPFIQFKDFIIITDGFIGLDNKYPLVNLINNNIDKTFVFYSKRIFRMKPYNWLLLSFTHTNYISKIGLTAGFTKNTNLFYANNRIRSIRLIVNEKDKLNFILSNKMPLQYFNINKNVSKIELIITSIISGSMYDDTCISMLELLDKNNNNILIKDKYVVSEGGNYPNFRIMDKQDNIVFDPIKLHIITHSGDIFNVIPSPSFNVFAFTTWSDEDKGIILYNYNKNKYQYLLKEFCIPELIWLSENRIRISKLLSNQIYSTNELSINW